nr:MAG TPA: hypothetical protein [Caudoviricetes sp.]
MVLMINPLTLLPWVSAWAWIISFLPVHPHACGVYASAWARC